jgi:hypothetical protein
MFIMSLRNLVFVFVCSCFNLFGIPLHTAEAEDLNISLSQDLHPIVDFPRTDKEKVESELLNLLDKYKEEKDQGRIYAVLCQSLDWHGSQECFKKSLGYVKKGVLLPQPLSKKLELYSQWGKMEKYDAKVQLGKNWLDNLDKISYPFADSSSNPPTWG